jgi:hypothetical protein
MIAELVTRQPNRIAKDDSPDRRLARRVLIGTFVRSFGRIEDEEYRKFLE